MPSPVQRSTAGLKPVRLGFDHGVAAPPRRHRRRRFAGLYAAKSLAQRRPVDSRSSTGATSTCSSRCSTRSRPGALSPGEIAQPLRSIFRKQQQHDRAARRGGRHRPERREVRLSDGGPIAYDTLIVATGARHSYFGHDDWARVRARPEDDRRRARDPAPDPDRVRGRRARGRPGAAPGVDDVRRRRRRADRRRAGRRARRDRQRHAAPRLPLDRPPDARIMLVEAHGPRAADRTRRSRRASAQRAARAARRRRSGPGRGSSDIDEPVRDAWRGRRPRGTDPGADRAVGGRRAGVVVRRGRWPTATGAETGSGGPDRSSART